MFSSDAEDEHEYAQDADGDSADDVPHGVLGKFSGEGIADLIGDGMGCIHSEDEQGDSENKQYAADYSLTVHDWLRSD
jgi:hypothetical protein